MSSSTHEPCQRERCDKDTTSRAENKINSFIFYPKAQCILQCVALKVVINSELLIMNGELFALNKYRQVREGNMIIPVNPCLGYTLV